MLFKILLFTALVAFSAATTKEEAKAAAMAELKSSGMSQASIDGLTALDNKYTSGFPSVAGNKEALDKFTADFTAESHNFMNAMPANDKAIYDAFRAKQGILA